MSVELYEKTFYELEADLGKVGPKWVHKLRMAGMEMFKAQGFPTLRDENWRNTRVRPIAATAFARPHYMGDVARVHLGFVYSPRSTRSAWSGTKEK